MIAEIKIELQKLEQEKQIKILYAVESGSRAWGFASTNSDWDVRMIYVHQKDWYLSIDEGKDNFEFILPNDIDISGWELKKALRLFKKSNPPLLEWLRSPIVYKEEKEFTASLRNLGIEYFNPKSCLYHYFHMAKRNWEAYFKTEKARIKKYFYVLRPLLACVWIKEKNEMAPMEFDILLENAHVDKFTLIKIKELVKRKKAGEELDEDFRIVEIDVFIQGLINEFTIYLKEYNFINQPKSDLLNQLFQKTLINFKP